MMSKFKADTYLTNSWSSFQVRASKKFDGISLLCTIEQSLESNIIYTNSISFLLSIRPESKEFHSVVLNFTGVSILIFGIVGECIMQHLK